MAEVILFHHAQGLTPGVHAFADRLREGGHRVTVPDLFDGATFPTVEEGVAHARDAIGFEGVTVRGMAAAEALPPGVVYAGFSLGAMPAQKLAQTRAGARGALLYHSAVPVEAFGEAWPDGVPLQIHAAEDDEWEELDELAAIADAVEGAELHVYPGSAHLFCDASLGDYDKEATRLVIQRSLAFLDRLG